MTEVTLRLAVQGNGVVEYKVAEGTTVGELRDMANLNPHLEIRVGGNKVDDDFAFDADNEGAPVVGTQPVKGGTK